MENGSFNSQDETSVGSGPLSVAFGFVTRLASEIFARGKKHLDGSNSDAMDEVESQQSNEVSESGDDIDKNEDENRMATSECTTVATNDSSAEKSVDVVMADDPADSDCLKHFDILQCPPDHHYLENIAHVSSFALLGMYYLHPYMFYTFVLHLKQTFVLKGILYLTSLFVYCNICWYFLSCLQIAKQCSRVPVEESGSKKFSKNGAYLRRIYQVCFAFIWYHGSTIKRVKTSMLWFSDSSFYCNCRLYLCQGI